MAGLVISVPIEASAGSLFVKSSALDPQELRSNLLLWDKLDWPTNNLMGFHVTPDVEFLIQEGSLTRTRIIVGGGGSLEDSVRAAHVQAYRELDEREPGTWSLATGERSISFLDEELESDRGVLVRLHQAIPVPDKEVPFADVLEFKRKRRDELLALRYHLEQIYQRVISAGDGELALNAEVGALDKAIADHLKTAQEFGLKLRFSDLSASLNLLGAAQVAFATLALGLDLVSALVAGTAASISIDAGVALKRHKAAPTPFRYISSYHREVF